jgi:hypothetical protein
MALVKGVDIYLAQWEINATELAAGTATDYVSPVDGYVVEASAVVDTAIVTGGVVTFHVNSVPVDGLSLTVADAATKGTVIAADTPTPNHSTRRVLKGQRIAIVPSAAFAGGGSLRGYLKINTGASPAA